MKSGVRVLCLIAVALVVGTATTNVFGQQPIRISEVAGARQKLESENIVLRIEVLNVLVVDKRTFDTYQIELPYSLSKEDFSFVVRKILEKDLSQLDDKTAQRAISKVGYLMFRFSLTEYLPKIVAYIPAFLPTATSYSFRMSILSAIIGQVVIADAKEFAPQIATLLLPSVPPTLYDEALNALVKLKSKEAVPALVSRLYDKETWKKHRAISDLLEVNGREASPSIAKLLCNPDPDLRFSALAALVKFRSHRPYVSQIWEVYSTTEIARPVALAALVEAGESKAIPLSIDIALVASQGVVSGNLKPFVEVDARQIILPLIQKLREPSLASDIGTDSNLRAYVINTLEEFRAKEAIPVLTSYVRERNRFLQNVSAKALGELDAFEAVDALRAMFRRDVPRGSAPISNDTYDSAEAGLALAKIGDRQIWNELIAAAENPLFPYRSQIIIELNKHIDKDLWAKAKELKLSTKLHKGSIRTIVSIKELAEIYTQDTGVPVILEFEPGKDVAKRAPLAPPYKVTNGYPWAYTPGIWSLLDGLREFPIIISDGTLPQNFTFIFDNNRIRILTVEKAVLWWKERLLSASKKDART